MALITAPGARRRRTRDSGAEVGKANPLVYVLLVLGTALSVFPLYFMFVVATRTNDVIGGLPPVLTPGGAIGDNVDRLLANQDAHFLRGLGNSVLVSAAVTVSVVLFSSLAGFALPTSAPLSRVRRRLAAGAVIRAILGS